MEPSPLEISELRLRLRALSDASKFQELSYILSSLADLGDHAALLFPDVVAAIGRGVSIPPVMLEPIVAGFSSTEALAPLVPTLIAAMRSGVRLPTNLAVPIITRLKSAELLDAVLAQSDGRCSLNTMERSELLKAGFTQFEAPLLEDLFGCFERADSLREEIVKALAEGGTHAAFETLEVIDYRVASRIPELRAELHYGDVAEQATQQILGGEFWRWNQEFLQEVRQAILRIRERPEPPPARSSMAAANPSGAIGELLRLPESDKLEFKASLRADHMGAIDEKLERRVMQTVAGFANAHGGTIIIGVEDSGKVVGLTKDYALLNKGKGTRDAFERHLRQCIESHFGEAFTAAKVRTSFPQQGGTEVCRLDVEPVSEPLFLKSGGKEDLYVRSGNANKHLQGEQVIKYSNDHFPGHK